MPNAVPSSPTSTFSYDIVSSRSRSSSFDSDEIVWSPSSGYLSTESNVVPSFEDDYVVLSRPRSPHAADRLVDRSATPLTSELVSSLENLSVSSPRTVSSPSHRQCHAPIGRNRRHKKRLNPGPTQGSEMYPSLAPTPRPDSGAEMAKRRQAFTGLGSRPIVDDVSESASVADEDLTHLSMYEEAVKYISSFLSNPSNSSVNRLTFLQSLIIELGLATSSLPASLKSAKAVLRSHAFLNVREYLAVRGEGLAAIQHAMYPSKSALIRDIRRNRDRASVQFVKQNGLQVLLVNCYH